MTINDYMSSMLCDSFGELRRKLTDYVALKIELENNGLFRYIILLDQMALKVMDPDSETLGEAMYTSNNVLVFSYNDQINGYKIKSIEPITKKDLTAEELVAVFNFPSNVFEDTECFQKFYGLMTETEDQTEPPYFIKKENLMVKIGHLKEELAEIEKAAENGDLPEFADGIIDLIYVASGLGNLCRLPMQMLWNDVQNSNMVGKERVKSLDNATKRGTTFDVRKGPKWVGPRGADIIEHVAKMRAARKEQNG